MNYYKRHLGDYARDTAHLSMLEHGAYTLLLDMYYVHDGELPAEERALFRLCRARTPEEQETIRIVLAEFFTVGPDGLWHHKRCDAEISEWRAKSDKAASSAHSRWKANAMRPHSERTAKDSERNADAPKDDAKAMLAISHKPLAISQEPQAAHTVVETPKSAREPAKSRAALPEDENPKTDEQDEPPQRNVAALIESLGSKVTGVASPAGGGFVTPAAGASATPGIFPSRGDPATPREITPTRHGLLAKFLRDRDVVVTTHDAILAEWIELQVTDEQCLQAIELARCRKPAPEKIAARYLDPILRDVMAGKRNGQTVERWWESETATDRKAQELGIRATGYDTYATLRDKIRERLKGAA